MHLQIVGHKALDIFVEGQFFGRNEQLIPGLIDEQRDDILLFQIQVVPAAFGLEALQLKVQPIYVKKSYVPRSEMGLVAYRVRIAAKHPS